MAKKRFFLEPTGEGLIKALSEVAELYDGVLNNTDVTEALIAMAIARLKMAGWSDEQIVEATKKITGQVEVIGFTNGLN